MRVRALGLARLLRTWGRPECASCTHVICLRRAPELHFAVNAGDFTKQRYLASMEGAVFSGKLAAQAIAQASHPPCKFVTRLARRFWQGGMAMLLMSFCSRRRYTLGSSEFAELFALTPSFSQLLLGVLSSQGWLACFIVVTKHAGAQDWNGRHVPMQHSANGASARAPAAQPELQPVAALQGS